MSSEAIPVSTMESATITITDRQTSEPRTKKSKGTQGCSCAYIHNLQHNFLSLIICTPPDHQLQLQRRCAVRRPGCHPPSARTADQRRKTQNTDRGRARAQHARVLCYLSFVIPSCPLGQHHPLASPSHQASTLPPRLALVLFPVAVRHSLRRHCAENPSQHSSSCTT